MGSAVVGGGVFFFSGFVDGSNMRLVTGGACLVGVARHQWNKVLQVFLQLVAIYSGGGGGPVKFELLGSVAPAGASEGVGSCTGVWGRHLLAMSSWLWECAASSLSAAVVQVAAAGQVEARGRTSNKDPTADDRVSRISCSNPRLGVRSLFWRATVRGLLLQRVLRLADEGHQRVPRKEKDVTVGGGLFVILVTFRDLSARKGCTVQTLFTSFSRKKKCRRVTCTTKKGADDSKAVSLYGMGAMEWKHGLNHQIRPWNEWGQ